MLLKILLRSTHDCSINEIFNKERQRNDQAFRNEINDHRIFQQVKVHEHGERAEDGRQQQQKFVLEEFNLERTDLQPDREEDEYDEVVEGGERNRWKTDHAEQVFVEGDGADGCDDVEHDERPVVVVEELPCDVDKRFARGRHFRF